MTIPLWLPWAVVAALVLTALFTMLDRRDRSGAKGFAGQARTWSASVVALVVAGTLTLDHQRVSEDELFDAVAGSAAVADGALGNVTPAKLQIGIEDRLGREVLLDAAGSVSANEIETVTSYQVRVSEDSGPAVCVAVTQQDAGEGAALAFTTLSASRGACASSGE